MFKIWFQMNDSRLKKKDKTDLLILEKFTTNSCHTTKIVSYCQKLNYFKRIFDFMDEIIFDKYGDLCHIKIKSSTST